MNKKGFTLIELLAVIVILAVIALIAVPIITTIIDESKVKSAKISVQYLVSTIETNCQRENLKVREAEKVYIFTDGVSNIDIDIKGKLPSHGTIKVDDECNTEVSVIYNDYIFNKAYNEIELTLSDNYVYENGTVIYFDPTTGKTCNTYAEENSNVGNATGCMKWYVYNDAEENMSVTMLLDHNIKDYSN